MKYGFVIDNRKCIGCHACTTACKSEHQVPVGVNRTWVKQVEKGEFPNTRRLFSVMRCNHCTDAPCVEICPTESLYFREDGIVDFDKDRCIGCKSCMQACPYDALYIDPETHTAAKCNYCSHRVDVGLEPACVNVCPEEAIISGDMDDPNSKITTLLSRQQVKVRKPEKGTVPNLFYIDADDASLNPNATKKSDDYFWSSQSMGVGHFAKEAEKMAFSNGDLVHALMETEAKATADLAKNGGDKSVDVLMGKEARRIYDVADKGILWGWEVSAYVWTKAISAGLMIVGLPFLILGGGSTIGTMMIWGLGLSLFFLMLTGLLLIKDLDRPDRFLNVLLRPQWKSWLVKGGYGITFFGLFTSLLLAGAYFNVAFLLNKVILVSTFLLAIFVAIYTAFLFAQAKGRDFWQSPMLSVHMLLHSILAGVAVYSIILFFQMTFVVSYWNYGLQSIYENIFIIGLAINLFSMLIELATPHATEDSKRTVTMITKGRYKNQFWGVVILLGNIIPLVLLFLGSEIYFLVAASILVLIGIYYTNKIWVEAPQRIPLS